MYLFEKIFDLLWTIFLRIYHYIPKDMRFAHKFSSKHKSKLIKDNICGCFY
jgi:hypothetical protein